MAIGAMPLRHARLTRRPLSTSGPLQPDSPYHTPSVDSPQGVSAKSPDTTTPIEEERLPGYVAEQFYPVNIGDTLNSRYHVIGKLGYGANSMVWFCHDLSYALKCLVSAPVEAAYQ